MLYDSLLRLVPRRKKIEEVQRTGLLCTYYFMGWVVYVNYLLRRLYFSVLRVNQLHSYTYTVTHAPRPPTPLPSSFQQLIHKHSQILIIWVSQTIAFPLLTIPPIRGAFSLPEEGMLSSLELLTNINYTYACVIAL